MASPLETIVALLKAGVILVVTASTIKSIVSGSILKIPDFLVKNPASPMPQVTLLKSIFFPICTFFID